MVVITIMTAISGQDPNSYRILRKPVNELPANDVVSFLLVKFSCSAGTRSHRRWQPFQYYPLHLPHCFLLTRQVAFLSFFSQSVLEPSYPQQSFPTRVSQVLPGTHLEP